jgi:hypothetical protein
MAALSAEELNQELIEEEKERQVEEERLLSHG